MGGNTPHNRRAEWSDGTRRAVRSLRTFEPYTGSRWPLGIQAGLAMAIPAAVGALVGEQSLGLLAATGGFTTLHLTSLNVRERMRVLPLVAVFLLAATTFATVLAPHPLIAAVGLVVVTLVGTALSFGYKMGPPGPLFAAMSYGLAMRVTGVVNGDRAVAPLELVVAVAAGTALALLIAATPLVRATNRAQYSRRLRDILPKYSLDRQGRELFVRVAIVTVLGTLISIVLIDPDRAYWTVGAGIAVIGVRAGRGDAARRGLHRVVGTFAGALVFLSFGALEPAPLVLALVLGALQYMVVIVAVRNYALALIFITPMVLLLTGAATGSGASFATLTERVIDTAIGALLGTATGLLHGRTKLPTSDSRQ